MLSEAKQYNLCFAQDRYRAIFPEDEDHPIIRRHDEMRDKPTRKLLWSIAEHAPRWELHNEPPPPHTKFTLRAEAFNILNRVRMGNPDSNVTSANFGIIRSQGNDPRRMQFGAKIVF